MGTAADDATQRAVTAEMNKIVLRLREAGVNLYDPKLKSRFKIVTVYWNPTGFDFICDDWRTLDREAQSSKHMASHHVKMPGYDPWEKAGVVSAGYSQVDVTNPVHFDVAIDRPGLCRVYVSPRKDKLQRGKMHEATMPSAREGAVYKKIAKRLQALNPSVNLDEHIGLLLGVGPSPLEGVNFEPRDYDRLVKCLEKARDANNQPAFAPGSKLDQGHWPLAMSYLATEGIGYREIWRPKDSGRALEEKQQTQEDWEKQLFSANFGPDVTVQDLSSLHLAVSKRGCNVHIDNQGFVMLDAKGRVILNPNFLAHALVELFWKTMLQGKLPLWMLNRVSFDIPSTPNDFARAGVSLDLIQSKQYKLTLRGTCSILGGFDCSGTLTFSGNF